MDLRLLTTFCTIVEEGSFLRAAEVLDYAQSTITLHMQQLEAQLNAELFIKRGRSMVLTEAGQALYDQSHQILDRVDGLKKTVNRIANGKAGYLRFASLPQAARQCMTPLLIDFIKARPDVQLHIEVGGTKSVCALVAQREVDFGICSPPPAALGLTFEKLFDEELVLLLPDSHPLAHEISVVPGDLENVRLIVTEPGCAYRVLVEEYLFPSGLDPYSGIEVSTFGVIKSMVQAGIAAAILPVSSMPNPLPGTKMLDFSTPIALPVGIVQKKGSNISNSVTEAFLEIVREKFRAYPQL